MRTVTLHIVSAITLIVFLSLRVCAQEHPEQTSSRLRMIGQAMQMYANENKGYFPPDLAAMAKYLGSPAKAAEVQRDVSYAIPPGTRVTRVKNSATVPAAIAKSREAEGDVLAVLFVDGSVKLYAAMNEQQRVDAAMRIRDAAMATRPTVTRPAAPAEPPSGDVAKQLIGAWQTSTGRHLATYQFEADGTFTLSFAPDPATPGAIPGSGKAAGTWRLDGQRLVMINIASDTPFTIVGEEEDAEIVRITQAELVLRTTDRKGKPMEITLARSIPFRKGMRDNEAIVGTWNGDGTTLVLAESGMAVFRSLKGEWSQAGNKLKLQFESGLEQRGPRQESLSFDIDLLNETTLVLTVVSSPAARERRQTFTLLRVK